MNLLELQQRANVIVQKVNEYEANLVGSTLDEADTLNQHKYADLYCLRPVLKLLFGKNVQERINRTLSNDVDLRLYASSAPAWNTHFPMITASSSTQEIYNYTVTGSPTISNGIATGLSSTSSIKYSSTTIVKRSNITDLTQNYAIVKVKFKINQLYSTSKTVLAQISFNGSSDGSSVYYAPNISASVSSSGYLQMVLGSNSATASTLVQVGDIIEVKFKLELTSSGCRITLIEFLKNDTSILPWEALSKQLSETKSATITTLQPTLTFGGVTNAATQRSAYYVDESGITLFKEPSLISADLHSDTHEFMNNIDMMNVNNMLQLDIQQNTLTSLNNRIKQGINYSYSSNIQDALVTESQVANVFKWNTTVDEETQNNRRTVNRQVPGIVLYYLGNNYYPGYTATIPYNPTYGNINAVNYLTPSYYGTYYTKDPSTSQVPLEPGAECCRIFMPGCTYTRGLLMSPQQIWQPDKIVGDDNIDKGFNWQGKAIYHELVFKNRRAGAKEAGVDFIPTLSTIADNDPQGLAIRTTLAKQKQFYYNRPWFKELDELVTADTEALADSILDNTGTISYTPQYTTAGSPAISSDYILTNTSQNNYVYMNYVPTASTFNSMKVRCKFKTGAFTSGRLFLFGNNTTNQTSIQCGLDTSDARGKYLFIDIPTSSSAWGSGLSIYEVRDSLPLANTEYILEFTWNRSDGASKLVLFDISGNKLAEHATTNSNLNWTQYMSIGKDQNVGLSDANLDLKEFKVWVNDVLVEELVKATTGTMNDTQFLSNYKLDYDTWATALNKPL